LQMSINFKNIQQTTLNALDVNAQQTFNDEDVTSTTSFFYFSIEKILTQKKTTTLKNIMHFKTKNYSMNEIIDKRTLSQSSKNSMSLFSRQWSVSEMQIFSSQTSNAFNVLRNRSSTRASQKSTLNDRRKHNFMFQIVSKSRKRSLNNKKTIESKENDDEFWRHNSFLQFYNTRCEMNKNHNNVVFNRFSNQEIWFIDNSKIITQRMCFDVLQFVQHRFLSALREYRKRENLFLCQYLIACELLICELRFRRRVHHANSSDK
jgi:hypothetical protein